MDGRTRILTTIAGERLERLAVMPITMMFAADRIGVRYREYVSDYRTLVEAQIRTAEEFEFDYVSVISDPGREGHDLGASLEWFDDQPPAFLENSALLADKSDLGKVGLPAGGPGPRMLDRVHGVAALKAEVGSDLLVEGWIEGPCAQGANLRGINTLMLDFFDDPLFVRELFQFILELELAFARLQIDAGADLIGIGDAAASLVGPRLYREFVYPVECRLVQGIREMGAGVRLHICGRTGRLLPWMMRTGAEIVDLDWMVSLEEARRQGEPGVVLLGNIDPVEILRNSTPTEIRRRLADCHRAAAFPYIVGAGCEVVRDTPEENVRAMVDFAKSPVD